VKRIAILIHGGIGTGPFSQGVPMLHNIVRGLSEYFEIVVYSQSTPNADFHPERFIVQSPSAGMRPSWRRWLHVFRSVVRDNRKKRFDIVIAFWGYPAGLLGVMLSKFIRCPSVIYLQGGDAAGIPEINYGTFHKAFPRALARWAYERTTLLIAMSLYQRDAIRSYGIKNHIYVIPWGLDLQKFPFRSKTRNNELHVIHVGHFSPVKDQATVIKAFAEIVKSKPAKLRLFGGDAGMKRSLELLCAQLNITHLVEFNDLQMYDDMPQHYAWADVMLHTSLSEGQCMALTEAAASGVLMAGTNVAPLYDLGDTCGLIIDRRDHHALATAVLQLLSRPDDWRDKVDNARRWIEQHPLDWTLDEIKNLLMTL
jgi:glycosyltransferase involved in cell wall biosynthesis